MGKKKGPTIKTFKLITLKELFLFGTCRFVIICMTSMWPRCDLDVISMCPRCDLDAQPRMVVWSWYLQNNCLRWLWRSTTQLTTGEARNERPYYDIVCKWRSTTPQPQAEARNERMRNVVRGALRSVLSYPLITRQTREDVASYLKGGARGLSSYNGHGKYTWHSHTHTSEVIM